MKSNKKEVKGRQGRKREKEMQKVTKRREWGKYNKEETIKRERKTDKRYIGIQTDRQRVDRVERERKRKRESM